MTKIILIPTSHIAGESLENVRKTIERERPECIALELDINRYYALKQKEKSSSLEMIRMFGIFSFLMYSLLKRFQNYFGKKTGILPGSEMLAGVELARELGIKVAFIDQDIRKTFFEIGRIGISEKLKLFWLLIKAIFFIALPFGRKETIDLNRVPEKSLIDQAMGYFRKELPGFYRVLVEDRNKTMARNLKELSKRFDRIVCVIGAGHKDGLKRLL